MFHPFTLLQLEFDCIFVLVRLRDQLGRKRTEFHLFITLLIPFLKVFQSYYETSVLPGTPSSNMFVSSRSSKLQHRLTYVIPSAWIGSLQYSMVYFPAVISGRLFDLGYGRYLSVCSGILLVLATFLVPQCTQYWHFVLIQGVAIGLACGGIMTPTMAVISHWFKAKRGLAMGLMAVGSSSGGTIIPIMSRNLIPLIGYIFHRFPWHDLMAA
jgi:MFS transporter, MCT family, solute carrier family 16 (monocarboxylic acid transporters), member 10